MIKTTKRVIKYALAATPLGEIKGVLKKLKRIDTNPFKTLILIDKDKF